MDSETLVPIVATGLLSVITVLAILLILVGALYVLVRKVGEIDTGEMIARLGLKSISLTVERRIPPLKLSGGNSRAVDLTVARKGKKVTASGVLSTCTCRGTSSRAD